jgi:biotin transporter BioY
VLFAAGISWLAVYTHNWRQAAFFGLYPFVFAEVSKVMVAAAGAKRLRRSF